MCGSGNPNSPSGWRIRWGPFTKKPGQELLVSKQVFAFDGTSDVLPFLET